MTARPTPGDDPDKHKGNYQKLVEAIFRRNTANYNHPTPIRFQSATIESLYLKNRVVPERPLKSHTCGKIDRPPDKGKMDQPSPKRLKSPLSRNTESKVRNPGGDEDMLEALEFSCSRPA
jgi:hypothetical protein